MRILVANAGSTSLKFKLFDFPNAEILARGKVERVGDPRGSIYSFENNRGLIKDSVLAKAETYREGIDLFLNDLGGAMQADVVAFKTVLALKHPGIHIIDDEVIRDMEESMSIAPVHNSAYLATIRAFQQLAPFAKLVGVFETAFHMTMPMKNRVYGVPYEWYENYGVMRMGFHGASHSYVAQKTAGYSRVISCHLGGSSSLCAIKDGKSIENSFGLSLQAGITHVSRAGDIDPYIMPYLLKLGMPYEEVIAGLEKKGGLKGISGTSGDMRDLREEARKGNARAKLAIDVFTEGVRKYIGAYAAVLGGVDALCFTAGIGENDSETRKEICEGLEFLGIALDENKNRLSEYEIGAGRVKVFVIPADEETVVARSAYELLNA